MTTALMKDYGREMGNTEDSPLRWKFCLLHASKETVLKDREVFSRQIPEVWMSAKDKKRQLCLDPKPLVLSLWFKNDPFPGVV